MELTDDDIDRICNHFNLDKYEFARVAMNRQRLTLRAHDFESFWIAYKRKGNKKQARAAWDRMSEADKAIAMEHAPKYIASRELTFCKDAERYLKYEVYHDRIIEANNPNGTTVASIIEYKASLFDALGLSGVDSNISSQITGGT